MSVNKMYQAETKQMDNNRIVIMMYGDFSIFFSQWRHLLDNVVNKASSLNAYILCYISAKNYQNRLMNVNVIVRQSRVIFF